VLASRLGGLAPPWDGVTSSVEDETAIYEDATYAAGLGFGGKLCIHPRQIAPARRGFKPDDAQISWAQRVIALEDTGATKLDGAMIDAPVRARARRILKQAFG
jgi:citrate lyase subunit beta/citryl-CoA lyase